MGVLINEYLINFSVIVGFSKHAEAGDTFTYCIQWR